MGFALVLTWMLVTAAILGVVSLLTLKRLGVTHASGALVSLLWWIYVIAWWSAIAGPSALTPRNVRVFSAPVIYYGVLAPLFLGTWISLSDLFGHVSHTPKGRKSVAMLLGIFLAGFLLSRRISVAVVVVAIITIILIVLTLYEGRWLPGFVMTLVLSLLIVYLTSALLAGKAHEIRPAIEPVPADQDEVFFYAPFRKFGWYFFFAFGIIAVALATGLLSKSWWIGIAVFVGLYSLYTVIVFLTQFVNALALGFALVDAIPGADVQTWISDLGEALSLDDATINALKALANPVVSVEGQVATTTSVDEAGFFPWPF